MTNYLVSYGNISKINVLKKDGGMLHYLNSDGDYRERILDRNAKLFDTFCEAKEYLIKDWSEDIKKSSKDLEYARKALAELIDLQEF